MAIDALKYAAGVQEDGSSVLPGLIGVAPIVGGVALGMRGFKGNQRLKASDIISQGSELGKLGRSIGQQLKDEVGLEHLTEELMKSGKYNEMINKAEERNAVIQSLLSTLDDPSSGFEPEHTRALREKLLSIVEIDTPDEDARKLIKSAVNTIFESGSEPLKRRFASRVSQFSQVSSQLTMPKFDFTPGSKFTTISHANMRSSSSVMGMFSGGGEFISTEASKVSNRYERLLKMLGPGAERRVEIIRGHVAEGVEGLQARVFSGQGPGRGTWQTTITLATRLDASSPANLVRMGENLPTAYGAGRHYANAQSVLDMLDKGSITEKSLRKAGVLKEVSDYQLDAFERAIGGKGYLTDRHGFNSQLVETMEVAPRTITSNGAFNAIDSTFSKRQSKQFLQPHNTLVLTGMEALSEAQKDRLLTGMVGLRIGGTTYDPGVGAGRLMSNFIDGRQHAVLQQNVGSALSGVRIGVAGGANRLDIPVVARLEQIMGRTAEWVGGESRYMGRSHSFRSGAGQAPIEWASDMVSGTTNKVVLMDVTMGTGRGALAATEGWGQAYTVGKVGTMRSSGVIPILDPKSIGQQSSALLERLLEARNAGKGMIKLTREELEGYQHFLGTGPAGQRSLPKDPRMQSMWVGISEVLETKGKQQYQVSFVQDRSMDMAKVFGTLHKGTVVGIAENQAYRDLSTYGLTDKELRKLGINLNDTIITSGDMLKKAKGFLNIQMITGMDMVTGGSGDPFRAIANSGAKSTFGGGRTGDVAEAVMSRLSTGVRSGKVGTDEAGRVLAGLYYGSGLARADMGDSVTGAYAKGFDAPELRKAFVRHFGKTKAQEIIRVAQKGLAIGAGSFAPGTGHGDYMLGRGSVEPRFFEFASARLRDMGMKEEKITDFMTSILKRKIGVADARAIVSPMEQMVASHINAGMPGQGKTLSLSEFVELQTNGKFSDYLKTQKGGVYLDVASGSTIAESAVAAEGRKAFGGSNPLYFPGGDAMDHMHGAEIKQSGKTVQVGSSYERHVNQFADNVTRMVTGKGLAESEAGEVFKVFKKESARMYADSLFNMSRGKIKGSAMTMMQGYSVYSKGKLSRVGMSENRLGAVRALSSSSYGQAMFMDDKGFLSMLKDYKGKDKASLLKMFYSSSETALQRARAGADVGQLPGIMSMSMRNPLLGYGNVNVGQIYRDVQKVGQGRGDQIFDWLRRTNTNAIKNLEEAVAQTKGVKDYSIGGFSEIASLGEEHDKSVKRFFSQMASGLKKWTAEGGGATYFPELEFTVHMGENMSKNVDFGLAGGMIGDFDGDQANTILLDKTQRLGLLSTLQENTTRQRYLNANAAQLAQGATYQAYGKAALNEHIQKEGEFLNKTAAEIHAIQQDLLKEKASKRATGPLDVQLNNIRRAVLNMKTEDAAVQRETLSLLQMLEEHGTIKSKKLPIFQAIGDRTTMAIQESFQTGEIAPLKDLLENTIFPRAQFEELYTGLDLAIENSGKQHAFAVGADGTKVNLDNVISFMADAISSYRAVGGQTSATANILAAQLAGNTQQAQRVFAQLIAGEMGIQSGMASAMGRSMASSAMLVAEGGWGKVVAAAGKMDSRLMGGAVLGMAAGAAILGATGMDQYDSTPLAMPGEMPSAYVSRAATSYNLLESPARMADSVGSSDPYDLISRPINQGQTLVQRPTGYSIQGESATMTGIGRLGGYLNNLTRSGGVGSVMVNDMRRPLSPAYVDRAMGEY